MLRRLPAPPSEKLLAREERSWTLGESHAELGELSFSDLTARQRVAAEYLHPAESSDPGHADRGLPARMTDWLVATELAASPEFAKRCFTGIDTELAARATAMLTRAGADDPRIELEAAIALLAGEIEDLTGPLSALAAVHNALPYPAPAWHTAGAALCGRIVALLGPAADPAMRGYWLNSLGARDWQAGRRAEAVSRTEQAVTIRRELSEVDPDRHLASLALSLSNLGHQLADLGRTSAAISAIEEASLIYRAVAVVSPTRHLPSLAATLTRLGHLYERDGRHEEAQQASDEAALLQRELNSPQRAR